MSQESDDDIERRTLDHDGIDWISAALAVATALTLAGTAWMHFSPRPARKAEPPRPGSAPAALALTHLADGSPRVIALGGTAGRVVWVSFWSAASPAAASDLKALDPIWGRLRSRPHFTMAVAAVDAGQAERVRAAVAAAGPLSTSLPLYVATPATARAFGAEGSALPLHVLIDTTGQILAVARGRDPATLARLLEQAERRLEPFEPLGPTRFALAR